MTASTALSAMRLDGKGGGQSLSTSEMESWSAADGLLWVHCDQNEAATADWLESTSDISETVAGILLAGETRPRAIVDDDTIIIILRGINMNPGAMPDDMVAIRVLIQESRIITSFRRPLLSTQDIRDSLESSQGPRSVGEFLITLISALNGRIDAAIENIEQLVVDIEDAIEHGQVSSLRSSLGVVRRQAAAIRRYIAPQRDALERLVRSQSRLVTKAESFELREESDRLTRLLEDLDLAREHALVTQEEIMNRVAQEQNSRMYLLSVVAAIFLPLTFASGVLGMNVAGLPGVENPNGFVYSAIVMLVLGVSLLLYFRWKKWV